MKEHSFRTVVLKNKNREKRKTVITFSDDAYGIVSEFINGELESFHEEISCELKQMKETGSQARFGGSRICFAADPDRTLIYEEGEAKMRWCEIGTDEFLELIREWEQERLKTDKSDQNEKGL